MPLGCWQPIASNANLLSLSGLSYATPSFVKMTGANTFALDTTLYQPLYPFTITGTSGHTYNLDNLNSGGSSFNPATPGPIGGTTPAAITGTTITAQLLNHHWETVIIMATFQISRLARR